MKMQRNNFWEVFNILPGLAENPSMRSPLYQISYSSSIGLVKDIAFIIDLVYIILQNMIAPAYSTERSRLTIMTQYCCDVQRAMKLNRSVFMPEPKVRVQWAYIQEIL